MAIRNINVSLGDVVTFDSIEEMAQCVTELGYMPVDGLVEGRDYEVVRDPYTEEDEASFVTGFCRAMSERCPGYDFDGDCEAATPWCAPWTWSNADDYQIGDDPESDGYEFGLRNAAEINTLLEEEQA